ncbi:hypothetical protein CBM2587_B50043 [Cupriavidus taiwanensis]|uniref:Uncharacterized protein n=1 Tax=Cupriavidus taiwanensis TaxID=164546 RepID=A0A375C493_9BURK|nr:hypothetical protein CBM2587_B50043 [Cupriavidus taiwanensis]
MTFPSGLARHRYRNRGIAQSALRRAPHCAPSSTACRECSLDSFARASFNGVTRRVPRLITFSEDVKLRWKPVNLPIRNASKKNCAVSFS